jgi:hypothetical protein
MTLVYDTVVMLGICFILKYGAILNFIRNPLKRIKFFNELFSCALCMGFWIGLSYSVITPYEITFSFYTAAICWISDYGVQIIQKHLYPD